MAQDEELSDDEIVRLFSAGADAAFGALFRRHDAALVCAVARQLRGLEDRDGLAREIVDDLWLHLWSHPAYLLKHDPRRRPLDAYLAFLAGQEAKRLRRRLWRKDVPATRQLGDEDVIDPSIELDLLAEQWQDLVSTVSDADVAFLEKMFTGKRERTKTEQKRLDRLFQKLRQQFGLC